MASLTCHGGGGAKQVRLERIVRVRVRVSFRASGAERLGRRPAVFQPVSSPQAAERSEKNARGPTRRRFG